MIDRCIRTKWKDQASEWVLLTILLSGKSPRKLPSIGMAVRSSFDGGKKRFMHTRRMTLAHADMSPQGPRKFSGFELGIFVLLCGVLSLFGLSLPSPLLCLWNRAQ